MRIENEITVPASVEQTWQLLLDVPRVAPCMPGTEIVSSAGHAEWTALMRMRVGPMNLIFDVRLVQRDVDMSAHSVGLAVAAVEQKGRGTAEGSVNWALAGDGDETVMHVVTDLTLAGRVAQFARGVVEQLAADMTRKFAAGLAEELGGPTGPFPEPPPERVAAQPPAASPRRSADSAAARSETASPEPANVGRMLLPAIARSFGEFLRRLLGRGRRSAG